MINFLISILCFLFISNAHAITAWDPFDEMVNRSQDIISNRVDSARPTASDEDWPQESNQWEEDKEGYRVEVPLRVPSDADTKFMKVRYDDGKIKLEIPKKRLKSII